MEEAYNYLDMYSFDFIVNARKSFNRGMPVELSLCLWKHPSVESDVPNDTVWLLLFKLITTPIYLQGASQPSSKIVADNLGIGDLSLPPS